MRSLKKSGKRENFMLKLDMSKEYDRDEWDFLTGMMKHLGFHEDWIVLIMRSVCLVSYPFSLNGIDRMVFSFNRIKTRISLRPYLFLICAKGFSIRMQKKKRLDDGHNYWKGKTGY